MQINVALDIKSKEQAKLIRNHMYPNTTANQTRDSFIFNQCIDEFNEDSKVLLAYVDRDKNSIIHQRKMTIRQQSNDKLIKLAKELNISLAATYRAIIAYMLEHLQESKRGSRVEQKYQTNINEVLKEKIKVLESELNQCQRSLYEITVLVEGRV